MFLCKSQVAQPAQVANFVCSVKLIYIMIQGSINVCFVQKMFANVFVNVKVACLMYNSPTPSSCILDRHHMANISLWHHARIYSNDIWLSCLHGCKSYIFWHSGKTEWRTMEHETLEENVRCVNMVCWSEGTQPLL